ncbi:hypothetical protein CRUP_014919 [Coryphaenoides rupestris]|nr:hypothetical protein CRUP_014919 [Coryphaenoides rupestris]
MSARCYPVAMDLGVCHLRHFSISLLSSVLGKESASDLVKSHLMYAVREEVEVLKEQIKELIEKNSQLEQENSLLKTLASPEQMAQFQAQVQTDGSPTIAAAAAALPPPPPASLAPPGGPTAPAAAATAAAGISPVLPPSQSSGPSA